MTTIATQTVDETESTETNRMAGSAAAEIDANPGVRAGKTALRLGLSQYTIDLLPIGCEDGTIATIASDGELGSRPTAGTIGAATVALLLEAADFVREVRVIDTPAWATEVVA